MSKVKEQVKKLKGGLGSLETEHMAIQPPLFEIQLANGRHLATTRPEELMWFYKLNGTGTQEPHGRKKGGKSKGARNKTKSKVQRTRDAT